MGGDRSFHGMFTCMLKVLQCFKNKKKRKQRMKKRSTVKYEEVKNIEKNIFVILFVYLKQSEKERKLMDTNY